MEEIHETKLIQRGEHEPYLFDMNGGDELVFSIDANDCLDLVICHEEDLDAWADGDEEGQDGDERPLPSGYWHRSGVIECREQSFEAPEDGCYVLLLVNWGDEATVVTIDAAVWDAEE